MNPSTTKFLIIFVLAVFASPSVAAETRYDLAPEQEGHTLQHEIVDRSASRRTIPDNERNFETIQVVTQTSVYSSGEDHLPPLDGSFQANLDTDIAASSETVYEDAMQQTAVTAVPRNNLRGPQSSIQVAKQTQSPVPSEEGGLPLNGDFQLNLDVDIAAFSNNAAAVAVPSNDLRGPESYQTIDTGVGCGLRCNLRGRA